MFQQLVAQLVMFISLHHLFAEAKKLLVALRQAEGLIRFPVTYQ